MFLSKAASQIFKGTEKKRVKTFLDEGASVPATRYVREMALPNFYFHLTTAYDILRHLGVPLTKDDYLGI